MTMAHMARRLGSRLSGSSSSQSNLQNHSSNDDVVKRGYLSKRKRNRYFVLRKATPERPARLECYDSEKKFLEPSLPKKTYILKECFNICQSSDKHHKVIALIIGGDCVSLSTPDEREFKEWLNTLKEHKNKSFEARDGAETPPSYEHTWPVEVQPRSLAYKCKHTGPHYLCLTSQCLSLVKVNDQTQKLEFQLNTIKMCQHLDKFFIIEAGTSSRIGSGSLYMETEDHYIAQNIKNLVHSAMNCLPSGGMRNRTTSDPHRHSPTSTRHRTRCDSEPNPRRLNTGCTRSSDRPSDVTGVTRLTVEEEIKFDIENSEDTYINMITGEETLPPSIPATSPLSPVGLLSLQDTHLPDYSPQNSYEGGIMPVVSDGGYLPMFAGTKFIDDEEIKGAAGTLNQGHFSPSEEDPCAELSLNSGSSSCTSETASEHGGDDRERSGHTLHMWLNQGHTYSESEDSDLSGGARSTRTNSVGSKSEQYKRKTRLEATALVPSEPPRVRAFSVGSKVSSKFGMGRHGSPGQTGGPPPDHPPAAALGEIYPSIKECGSQAKNKSSSAPMLVGSPVSHSWSPTTGTYFRGLSPAVPSSRNHDERDKMMLDFSSNKSCDFIPYEDKESDRCRKLSKDRLWHTFTGHRYRSNSKSSGGSSNPRLVPDKPESKGVEIPFSSLNRSEYGEINFASSPCSSSSDPSNGYLPMYSVSMVSSSLTSGAEIEKRGPRKTSFNEPSTYVDMTQGAAGWNMSLATSSSSSNSLNGGRARGTSNIYAPTSSSQELTSPIENVDGDEEDGMKSRGRLLSSRKSMRNRDSSEGSEGAPKTKSSGPLSTFTNFISRKSTSSSNNSISSSNSSLKAPLSPKASPLPPKAGKETTSPFSSLTRSKSKKNKEISKDMEFGKEGRLTLHLPSDSTTSTTSVSPQLSVKSIDKACNLCSQENLTVSVPDNVQSPERRISVYMNVDFASEEGSPAVDRANSNYTCMQPSSTSSPALSPSGYKGTDSDSSENDAYVFMGIEPSPSTAASSSTRSNPGLSLQRLSLKETYPPVSSSPSERCRCRSGPVGSEDQKPPNNGGPRTASASTSPASRSPPTSPVLGSMSSISSLSEGGMSSASSTCTVVNVGLRNVGARLSASKHPSGDSKDDPDETSHSDKMDADQNEELLNYVALDLRKDCDASPKAGAHNQAEGDGSASTLGSTRIRSMSGTQCNAVPKEEDSSSYVLIDLNKTEGLRNTSIARESSRPH